MPKTNAEHQRAYREAGRAARRIEIPMMFDLNRDIMRPVTQADWDKMTAQVASFGRMINALREFYKAVDVERLKVEGNSPLHPLSPTVPIVRGL